MYATAGPSVLRSQRQLRPPGSKRYRSQRRSDAVLLPDCMRRMICCSSSVMGSLRPSALRTTLLSGRRSWVHVRIVGVSIASEAPSPPVGGVSLAPSEFEWTAVFPSSTTGGDRMATQWPEKDLSELEGADEYVVVTAWVNHIEELCTHIPYQKGILGDDSTWNTSPRKFVVYAPDLTLEEGNLYRIFGRDRTYEKYDEIQIEISDSDHVDLLCEGK